MLFPLPKTLRIFGETLVTIGVFVKSYVNVWLNVTFSPVSVSITITSTCLFEDVGYRLEKENTLLIFVVWW